MILGILLIVGCVSWMALLCSKQDPSVEEWKEFNHTSIGRDVSKMKK